MRYHIHYGQRPLSRLFAMRRVWSKRRAKLIAHITELEIKLMILGE